MEGRKGVDEVIHSNYEVHSILSTEAYADKNSIPNNTEFIDPREMQRLSSFNTAPGILALVEMKNFEYDDFDENANITLCLDGISDPGNLGTIIRTADWFGINQIVLSPDCTDFYNPKTLSATMGSFSRCKFVYQNLETVLQDVNSAGLFLEGTSIAAYRPQLPLFLVVGSESHGIRKEIQKIIKDKITITGYGKAESLNAGVAAGIAMAYLTTLK